MSEKNLYQRIIAVMAEVDTVYKNAKVNVTKTASYSAVLHDDVTKLIHPQAVKHGIVLLPSMGDTQYERHEFTDGYGNPKVSHVIKTWAHVKLINADNPTEQESLSAFAYAFDSGDKASGKAFSMAVKYCMLKAFMLESADNEEDRNPAIDQAPQRGGVAAKPAEFVCTVGKYKGYRVSDIDRQDLIGYCQFIMGKGDVNGAMKDFIDNARVYIAATKEDA